MEDYNYYEKADCWSNTSYKYYIITRTIEIYVRAWVSSFLMADSSKNLDSFCKEENCTYIPIHIKEKFHFLMILEPYLRY